MGKCLVTKLNGVIFNNSILKVGEMRVKFQKVSQPNFKTQGISFMFNKNVELKIIGDGYFTDSTLSRNNGKSIKVYADTLTTVYVSNADIEISIPDKYSLTDLFLNEQESSEYSSYQDIANKTVNIDNLAYSNDLKNLYAYSPKATGSIDSLKNTKNLTTMMLYMSNIYGSINSLDLSKLKNCSIFNSKISGDLSKCTLSNCLEINTKDTDITVSSSLNAPKIVSAVLTHVLGGIDIFKGISTLEKLSLYESSSGGDIATMPEKMKSLNISNPSGENNFSWTSRNESANIISLTGLIKLGNYVDEMLNNQARCTVGNVDNKIIQVYGTRTSASDAAVQTLQSKGYTVSISPA